MKRSESEWNSCLRLARQKIKRFFARLKEWIGRGGHSLMMITQWCWILLLPTTVTVFFGSLRVSWSLSPRSSRDDEPRILHRIEKESASPRLSILWLIERVVKSVERPSSTSAMRILCRGRRRRCECVWLLCAGKLLKKQLMKETGENDRKSRNFKSQERWDS